MQYWEIIADKLHASGWSWGYCSAVTPYGWRWIVDAHKDNGKRYIVHSDELLSAFLELARRVGEAASALFVIWFCVLYPLIPDLCFLTSAGPTEDTGFPPVTFSTNESQLSLPGAWAPFPTRLCLLRSNYWKTRDR